MTKKRGRGPDKGPRKPRNKPLREVSTKLLLMFYDAWLREDQLQAVALACDTSTPVLLSWIKKFPELQEAKRMAEEKKKDSGLTEYMFDHLSDEVKDMWEELEFWDGKLDDTYRFRKILKKATKRQRQELFLHALIHCGWNPSRACRMVCISLRTLDDWKKEPIFDALISEVETHRRNFFEEKLTTLAHEGDRTCLLFVNRTINANRGYSEKLQIEHQHSGTIQHVGFSIKDLELPMETRKEILQAIRARKAKEIEIQDVQVIEENSQKQLEQGEAE